MDDINTKLHELWGLCHDMASYNHEIKRKFGELQFAIQRERDATAFYREKEQWVEWVEPYGPNDEPCWRRTSAQTAIKVAKLVAAKHNHTYQSDEQALADFMAVHWAMFCPKEPSNEVRWAAFGDHRADAGAGDASGGGGGMGAVGHRSAAPAGDANVLGDAEVPHREEGLS